MSFSIRFVHSTISHPNLAFGEIVIGGYVAQFETVLAAWRAADYRRQWDEGMTRILFGRSTSCLVTSLPFKNYADFFACWSMRRNGDAVLMRQVRIPTDWPFDPGEPYGFFERYQLPPNVNVSVEQAIPLTDLQR